MSVSLSSLQWLSGSSFTAHCGIPLWDCEVFSTDSLGPLNPSKLAFTNLEFVLNLCIGFSLKEESGACTLAFFSPSTPNYTSLWFLTYFFEQKWQFLCFYLLSSRSRQLNLIKGKRVLVMRRAGFGSITGCRHVATAPYLTGLKQAGLQVRAPFLTRSWHQWQVSAWCVSSWYSCEYLSRGLQV